MTNQEPIVAAILAALNAIPGVDAFDLDEAPQGARRCVVVSLYRDSDTTVRVGGGASPTFFLDTTYRAETVSNCRELRRLVSARLDTQLVGDYGFRFNHESQPIDDDPDWMWSGVDTWALA